MSIWVKICKYQDFGLNLQKISIWVKILKILIWSHFVEKSQMYYKFSKNIDFGQTYRKILI